MIRFPLFAGLMGLGAFFFCTLLIAVLLPLLRRYGVLDTPNERSSHAAPTPRGGGWAMGLTLLVCGAVAAIFVGPWQNFVWLGLGFILLMVTSACDDIQAVSAKFRVFIQFIAVLCGLDAMSFDFNINQVFAPIWGDAVPDWIESILLVLSWVWFINLFNFMDGLDGLASVGALTVAIAVIIMIAVAGLVMPQVTLVAAAIIGAVGAFLLWNWHPAKMFMGDTGSVPLGYLLGFLLVALAQAGLLFAVLIPPLYFIADTTLTLIRRLSRGEPFWHAHREFYFHQAHSKLQCHEAVVARVIGCHIVLIVCAVSALKIGVWALLPAMATVAMLCKHFQKLGKAV